MSDRLGRGAEAERLVADYLRRAGFEIVGQNARLGRLEIDLVATRAGLTVFCEVRSRSSSALLDPIETIDRAKRTRIRRAAQRWLASHHHESDEVRFDAAAVLFEGDPPVLRYYEDAF